MWIFRIALVCGLCQCSASLPVIFGYPNSVEQQKNNDKVDNKNYLEEDSNALFVASVNHELRRPLVLKSNDNTTVSYNEPVERDNFVPIELNAPCDEIMSADKDFHPSYRRLVTRTIKQPMSSSDVFKTLRAKGGPSSFKTTITPTSLSYMSETDTKPVYNPKPSTSNKTEECYRNAKQLPRTIIRKMNKRRRKLAQSIRRLNKLQRTYCLGLSRQAPDASHSKCSTWREEKMRQYVRLLRITHCTPGSTTTN